MLVRAGAVVAAAAALVLSTGGAASAHITTDPTVVTRAEYNQISFRAPNESATASTVKFELTFPTATPITSVRTAPLPGWKAVVTKGKLPKPVTIENATITQAVLSVVWTAEPGVGIAPGQFGLFQILTGALPVSVDTLVIPATETYSDGKVVTWDQPPTANGEEPEQPAPVVKLTGSADEGYGGGGHAADPSASTPAASAAGSAGGAALWVAVAALVVAVAGAVLAGLTFRRGREHPTTDQSS
ncbi:hypothetical protein GCM10009765_23260 [Fodinicola feengrottensis]|uniref:YncI copper-binding domain-containing protein n=1 Tax=Fodinicola feengrottensis TaxID=435914 RepID=A0ABP4SI15_9ACTN